MLGRVILVIGNKFFISQDYTNVGIKREVENKTKTYLQRPNVTTYLQKLHMFMGKEHTYIYTWKNRKPKLGTGAKGALDNVSAKREVGHG